MIQYTCELCGTVVNLLYKRASGDICPACRHKARAAKYNASTGGKEVAHAKYERNKEKLNAQARSKYAADPAKYRSKAAKYYCIGKPCAVARRAKAKFARVGAAPTWANAFFIQEAYRLAALRTALTGVAWEVDHIVPLVHSAVCGLHTEFNIQVIPYRDNRVKSNKFST